VQGGFFEKRAVIAAKRGTAMSDVGKFSEKIERRLFKHAKEKAERLLQVDSQMKRLLEKRERFNSTAQRFLTSIVYPRMQELSRRFDNSRLKEFDNTKGFRCVCEFTPTELFPAAVSLDIALSSSGLYEHLDAHYDLEISPVLMEYTRYEGRTFNFESASCEEEISQWVETKLLDFVETYLQLETHPEYQKENIVTDPVCQMRFPIAQAAARIEQKGRPVYFCSEVCRENFQKAGK
jgi:YHS domain-containing protein